MSDWYHEYEFPNGAKIKDDDRIFPSRGWAFASADKNLTSIQHAFDEGSGGQCVINGQALPSRPATCRVKRVGDDYVAGVTQGMEGG